MSPKPFKVKLYQVRCLFMYAISYECFVIRVIVYHNVSRFDTILYIILKVSANITDV